MKSITINGSKRESVGKVATKALRNAGRVPCVLYGGGEPLHFSAPELDFSKLVYTPNAHTVVINLDGENVAAILQDIQFHPLTDKILHIDFYRLFDDKEVSMNIPVKVEGAAPGVLNSGGVLVLNKRKLRVKALPKDLPDFIVANISKLKLGNKLYTAELQTEEYTLLHPDNTVVCQVRTSRASVKEEEDEDDTTTEEGTEGGDTASAAETSEAPAES
ncbi:50S ribosomal protein L25/general stress protein Ctc [Flavobacteriaceae bacterium]|jgi:large subunit ribosomal protein L25|nr:50S ribosomal protein L25/general stress protein Ctc [Flavobacteriaceae bacterium]MBT5090853.1 50S ribosomal protein L25/general stress protein Ctc [Flavobacteriaceae bacterium]MBT5282770.1 50S ribosomal protein L25/general stress protein Ctc [Flavobacteriaceae bacterium]MBT5446164.1 50S ribosomal protein L25/general stress protein Ctc [Flavobacteriaceae bacterium]MBT5694127.1 50S ribosomal protein L25/general stress protein Ctc [Flavobacteriaceae bacterium]|tara:strand:+ start:1469 stop:2122 length:654 start_codon:yes stop_codon:yes gene_type:complete